MPQDRVSSIDGSYHGEFSERVETLVTELDNQLEALEELLSLAKLSDIAPPEQLDAIKRISPTVQDLVMCFNSGHTSSSNHRDSRDEPRRLSLPDNVVFSGRSAKNLMLSATSVSTKQLIDNVLEHTSKPRKGRHTVFLRRDEEEEDFESKIPKDLLVRMINSEKSVSARSSVAYIAQTYGGVELPDDFNKKRKSVSLKMAALNVMNSNVFVKGLVQEIGAWDKAGVNYLPTEFKVLSFDKKVQMARMLSWDRLRAWGFNAFEVEKISSHQSFGYDESTIGMDDSNRLNLEITERGCPIVLIGWAILSSPYAQLAMARNVNDAELIEQAENIIRQKANNIEYPIASSICEDFCGKTGKAEGNKSPQDQLDNNESELAGYYLLDKFGITPKAICHFLRKVEKEYPSRDANPYHNNIHASDVIQTTHALIQLGGKDLASVYSTLEIFTILIAAALHDVRHPGTNNNYQINKQTDLAMLYNDQSVLENMHASRASYLLKESGEAVDNGDVTEGIFGTLGKADRNKVRTGVLRSILSTDMSYHFKSVSKMSGYIEEVLDEINCEITELPDSSPASLLSRLQKSEYSKLREKLLPFILHLADISNPTKPPDVSIEWSNSAYDEFFQQGDKEANEGMPISPLCDRTTTYPPDGQLGFINYVVKPAFVVLKQCLPGVDEVLAQLDENLEYWEVMKAEAE